MYANQTVVDALPEAAYALLEIPGPATLTHLRRGYDAEDVYVDSCLLELLDERY
jgi:hypothetical protein